MHKYNCSRLPILVSTIILLSIGASHIILISEAKFPVINIESIEVVDSAISIIDSTTNLIIKAEHGYREYRSLEKAIDNYDQAIISMNNGDLSLALSYIEKSIRCFDKTVTATTYEDDYLSNAWSLKAAILFKKRNFDEAMRASVEATDSSPSNEYARLMRGCIFQSVGRYQEAIESYNATINLSSIKNNKDVKYIAENCKSYCLQINPTISIPNPNLAPIDEKTSRIVSVIRTNDIYISEIALGFGKSNNYDLNDEWVDISNNGTKPANLNGWSLLDEEGYLGEEDHTYNIPPTMLLPDHTIRIYSGERKNGIDLSSDRINLFWGRKTGNPNEYNAEYWKKCRGEIWNNKGDSAYLLDKNRKLISIMNITITKGIVQ